MEFPANIGNDSAEKHLFAIYYVNIEKWTINLVCFDFTDIYEVYFFTKSDFPHIIVVSLPIENN